MPPREKPSGGWISRLVRSPGSSANQVTTQEETARAAHARRREQIRRAQRTHRERKENYIKNLEAEVVVLREKDASHGELVAVLKSKIRTLTFLLDTSSIPVPADLRLTETPLPQASIAVQMFPDGTQSLHATMPSVVEEPPMPSLAAPWMVGGSTTSASESNNPSTPKASTATSQMSDREAFSFAAPQPSLAAAASLDADPGSKSNSSTGRGHQNGLDAAQIAVDFVLDLESPCLAHHTTHVFPKDDGNGHKLMLTTPIMSHYPKPFTSKEAKLPANSKWNVPAVEIEKLLNLSARLSLEGEITPVEAWQRIKRHPAFTTLDRAGLDNLKSALVPEVQCYGFGAVLDEQYFDFLLDHHLSNRMVFQ